MVQGMFSYLDTPGVFWVDSLSMSQVLRVIYSCWAPGHSQFCFGFQYCSSDTERVGCLHSNLCRSDIGICHFSLQCWYGCKRRESGWLKHFSSSLQVEWHQPTIALLTCQVTASHLHLHPAKTQHCTAAGGCIKLEHHSVWATAIHPTGQGGPG